MHVNIKDVPPVTALPCLQLCYCGFGTKASSRLWLICYQFISFWMTDLLREFLRRCQEQAAVLETNMPTLLVALRSYKPHPAAAQSSRIPCSSPGLQFPVGSKADAVLPLQREPCQNWHCLVKCHIHGKLCSRCAGMPFSLKAWVCFCSALQFTASRMSQQEFVASACSCRRGAFPQPGAASPGHSSKCSCILGREQRSPWVLPLRMGFGAATRLVFLSCCPT